MTLRNWLGVGFLFCLVVLFVCGIGTIFTLPFPMVAKVAIAAFATMIVIALLFDGLGE